VAGSGLRGYAIGSAQLLLIDWVRNRLSHTRHLRALHAEIRRAAAFNQKYEWQFTLHIGGPGG
jgi:hypothetical protein